MEARLTIIAAEIVVYPRRGDTHGFYCDDRTASHHPEAAQGRMAATACVRG